MVDHHGKPHTDALFLASVSRIYWSRDLNVGALTFKSGCKHAVAIEIDVILKFVDLGMKIRDFI
jgi:hypothetical protein